MTGESGLFLFKSGDLFLPRRVLNYLEYYWAGNDSSLIYISNWTIVHFISGVLTAIILHWYTFQDPILVSFLVHSIWEAWQIYGKNTKIGTMRGFLDVLMDTLFYMIGVLLTLYSIQRSRRWQKAGKQNPENQKTGN